MAVTNTLISELEDALHSGVADRRTAILRRVTDLFVGGAASFSDEQVEVFDDVIGRIATSIEAKAREELSRRIAPIPNAPIGVVRALAADDALEVAKPVLVASTRLADADLIEVIKTKSQGHLLAISTRQSLDPVVTDALVQRGDQQVVRTVANNDGAKFSEQGFEILVERSQADDVLGEIVGLRNDLPQSHFQKLLMAASDAVRSKLTAASPHLSEDISEILSRITTKTNEAAAKQTRDYAKAKSTVQALSAANRLDEAQVCAFAQQGSFEETAVALSTLCGIGIEAVERALIDRRADLTLIVAKSAGFSWETVKSILRFGTGGLPPAPAERDRILSQFNALKTESSKRVIRFLKVRETTGTARPN